MQVPFILSGEQPKVSIWLDNRRDDQIKQFHCPVCGKVVFEYYNDIKIIMAGEPGEVKKAPIVVQCHGSITVMKSGYPVTTRCKAKYWIEG